MTRRLRNIHAACVLLAFAFSARAADPWAISDAPFRAVVKTKGAPNVPDAGWAIEVPELGQTTANMGDVVLADAKGQPLPVAKVWRGEGQKVLLLAQSLPAASECYVYFGGNRQRRGTPWNPKVSLLMETRRIPPGTKMDAWPDLEAAWKSAKAADGAGFVSQIAHGENPFGESVNFLTRYTGWLKTDGKKLGLYTMSSDASFVLVNDKFEFGWPGKHGAQANAKSVPQKEVNTLAGLTRIDYFHAKEGGGAPTMLLGWMKGGAPAVIPAGEWAHAGQTEIVRVEHVQGWPVPVADVQLRSYIGWRNLWLYETHCALSGTLPAGWTATWEWDDGAKIEGARCERVVAGSDPVKVFLRLKSGANEVRALRRIDFTNGPQHVETNDEGARNRYLALFDRENPALLAPESVKVGFMFMAEFGSDQQIGKWGAAWIAKNPDINDPLWAKGQVARLRALAQTDPKSALAELHKFDSAIRKKYAKELGLCELDILVFGLKDASAVQFAGRIAFENPNSDLARVAKIRVGDLYRLLGRGKEAVEHYRAVQKTVADETQGRKFAAQDRGYSITIADLIAQGYRFEAEAKLAEWEVEHPMAKFDSDFLLLRARVLMLFGRWNEALQEIESFGKMNPDSPYQIPADYYRARALWELGKKDDARKLWQGIAKNFPKHEMAGESARLGAQK